MESLHFSKIKITGGFWAKYQEINRKVTLPAIYKRFEESGRFAALVCKREVPTHIYWDSDVAKWIEAAAYVLQSERDEELEKIVDAAVYNITANQLPSCYFNSHYISKIPDKIFKIRDNHELYCAGHFIEAAIAYHLATDKDKLLLSMIRFADYIYKVFFVEKSAAFFRVFALTLHLSCVTMMA